MHGALSIATHPIGYFFFRAGFGSLGVGRSSFSAGALDGVLPPAHPK